MPLLWLIPAGLISAGYFTDKVGEGVNDAGNGLIKLTVAAAVGFYVYKKVK